jgi:serine/threonine-protein kinase RsbW
MALLDLTVESSIEELQAIANQVDGVAEQQGWSQKTVFALQVALDEWISNVIKYSYKERSDQPIRVVVNESEHELVASVEDHGTPFDPASAAVPETLDETLSGKREGGMGLFVMHHLLSDIAFERVNNRNIVTLRVKL